jgi:GMP synthase (glutamine-hydrolysing) A subunit
MTARPSRPPHDEIIVILDFGSQYAQLIARRVREAGAFSLLVSPDITADAIRELAPKGIIYSGGPASVLDEGAPHGDPDLLHLGIPVLGICYGMQLACHQLGCDLEAAPAREYGRAKLRIEDAGDLLHGIPADTAVWMSHGDQVLGLADKFDRLAATPTCPYAAVRHHTLPFYGVQFHPEVTHTPHGVDLLRNFLYEICKCNGDMADERLSGAEAPASASRRQRSRDLRAERRGGFIGGGGAAGQGHRQAAHVHLRRQWPAAQERTRARRADVPRSLRHRPAGGGRRGRSS